MGQIADQLMSQAQNVKTQSVKIQSAKAQSAKIQSAKKAAMWTVR